MEEDIRDIVIRTDVTVKNLKDDFEKHEKDGNRKYEALLSSANTCVESAHIKNKTVRLIRYYL